MATTTHHSRTDLLDDVRESVARVLELTADFRGSQLWGPMIQIVNPPIWEIGHVGWFIEKWTLRHLSETPSLIADSDALYDSAGIAHDARWRLEFGSWEATRGYLNGVVRLCLERIGAREPTPDEAYFLRLALLHTDMHAEAFTYTRQTLGFTEPHLSLPAVQPTPDPDFEVHDVHIPGGRFMLGPAQDAEPFVFDNEKWAHEVSVAPFSMSATSVTNGEFLGFVEAGGYMSRAHWSEDGWAWRLAVGAERPVYWWRDASGAWYVRRYDQHVTLDPHAAIIHVNWHEANAYCAWAGRRLPTEAEWELAAGGGADGTPKRRFPWGDSEPTAERANIDFRGRGTIDVRALPDGDSPYGIRQMIGNAWEWTSTNLAPYPGFVVDPYKEYSEPWFHNHKVLRGGAWTTRGRLIRNTWRNFYAPDRRDVLCGFRTCATS